MDEIATKPPATPEQRADRPAEWRPFEGLRREVQIALDEIRVLDCGR